MRKKSSIFKRFTIIKIMGNYYSISKSIRMFAIHNTATLFRTHLTCFPRRLPISFYTYYKNIYYLWFYIHIFQVIFPCKNETILCIYKSLIQYERSFFKLNYRKICPLRYMHIYYNTQLYKKWYRLLKSIR